MLNGTYCSAEIILDTHGAHRSEDMCRKGRLDLRVGHLAPSSTCIVGRLHTAGMATEESTAVKVALALLYRWEKNLEEYY